MLQQRQRGREPLLNALRGLAALLLTSVAAAADVRQFAVDVPTTLPGGMVLLPRQIVQFDGSAYSIVAELPADVEIVALDRLADGRWLFAPQAPALLDGRWFGPRDVVVFDGEAYAVYFDGASAGVPSYAAIDAVAHDTNGTVLLSFDVPVALAGVEYGRSDLVRWSGTFSLAWSGEAAGVPAYANLVGVDRSASGSFVFGFDTPVELAGGNATFESTTSWPTSTRVRDFVIEASPPSPGSVPDGGLVPGLPLTAQKLAGAAIALTWAVACSAGGNDYEVYEGTIGAWSSHVPRACTTGGATILALTPIPAGAYYLVVPRGASTEGSYGLTSEGTQRPQSATACVPQRAGSCP